MRLKLTGFFLLATLLSFGQITKNQEWNFEKKVTFDDSVRIVDGAQIGYVLTSDSRGIATWQPKDTSGTNAAYKVLTVNIGNYPLQTITQFQNTIGDGSGNGVTDVKFDEPMFVNGVINAKMTANPFTAGKTFISCSMIDNGGQPYFIIPSIISTGWIEFNIYKYDGTQTGTPNFGSCFIEIRVYN
jgi:hypothetical protein